MTKITQRRVTDKYAVLDKKHLDYIVRSLDANFRRELATQITQKEGKVLVPHSTMSRVLDALPDSVKAHGLFPLLRAVVGF